MAIRHFNPVTPGQRKKSTLVNEILYKGLNKIVNKSKNPTGAYKEITGYENIDKIITENNKYECDYLTSMTIKQNDDGDDNIVSFPIESMYVDNGNYVNINDWVWRRNDGADKFSFVAKQKENGQVFCKDCPLHILKK